MPNPLISAVIPVRDRTGARLENCVRSLRWQREVDDALEVLVTDFGSSAEHARRIQEMAQALGARVIRVEDEGIWNRSKALNHGIQQAKGEFVFCTDADMIFEPNFVTTLLRAQQEAKGEAFVVCRCRDLPETVAEQAWTVDDFPRLLAASDFRGSSGTGACQVARRAFFERVRGYDEGYEFWGQEDNDMRFRAKRAGLCETWVHETTAMLHQWHPSDRKKKPLRKMLNDIRFHLTKAIVVKNFRGWGGRRG